MPSDTTYLFFQRDLQNGDDIARSRGPVIQSARVIRGPGSRAGSVPPMHFGSGSTRASSVQPLITTSSMIRRPLTSGSSSAVSDSDTTMTDIGRDGQLVTRRINRPLSIALAPAGLGRTISQKVILHPSAPHGFPAHGSLANGPLSHRRRASISIPSAGGVSLRSEGSKLYATVTPSGEITTKRSSIYYPSSSPSYGRSAAPLASGQRRASIAGVSPSTSSSSTLGNRRSSTAMYHHSPGYVPVKVTSGYPDDFSNDADYSSEVTVTTKRTDNDHSKKKINFENQIDLILPWQKESLTNLRARTQMARDQLSRHRVMLDRYLPVYLGPEQDVRFDVEDKYGELLSRMPHLEQREKKQEEEEEKDLPMRIEPYRPATFERTATYGRINLPPVKNSFTPKVSDTRKRARHVLCKVKNDPQYFNYN